MPKNILSSSRGLSLLETLIAIIILALALTSISYFFSTARENIQASGRRRCGLVLAQDKMEQLKDDGYSHPELSIDTHTDRVNSNGDKVDDGQFYREWIVSGHDDPADGTVDTDYKIVELKVYDQWLNPGNVMLNDPNKLVAELKTFISP